MRDTYLPVRTNLEGVIPETPNIKTFVLRPEEDVEFQTGQFIELSVPGMGEAPFTPSSSPLEKGKMDVTIMEAGRVTKKLHSLSAGATLGLRGPYGKGYPLAEFADKDILILGGGVGLAPLRSLLFALFADQARFPRIILCYGARTPSDLVYKEALKEWATKGGVEVHVTVDNADNGWTGNVGVVTTLLDKISVDPARTPAVVCGPPVMMKFGTFRLIEMGFRPENLYLSMEKNMSCGLGKCGHCRLGPHYVCKDGPVFTYDKILNLREIWE
jgi:NAD(P)H-flavin reductase